MKKFLKWLLIILLVLIVLVLIALKWSGAWSAIFPSDSHDTVAPALPSELQKPAVLLFTKTNGFRHEEGIDSGVELFKTIASTRSWGLYHTENGAVFNANDLQSFDAVVFHNATGDMLSDEQELAFQSWMEAGGGWMGTHAAGDGSHVGWDWYMENLLGATFTAHIMGPQFQQALVKVEQSDHPAVHGLPIEFSHTEEWYSWEESPRKKGFNILATIDENSYDPTQRILGANNDLRMGDHPVVWTNCIGEGRSLYSTLGHAADSYKPPEHQRLLEDSLAWVIGEMGGCAPE